MQDLVNLMAHTHQNHKKKRILNEAGHFDGPAASEYLKKRKKEIYRHQHRASLPPVL